MQSNQSTPKFRPYVVSWNLTYRCNLACDHCYLDAGGKPKGQPSLEDPAFADRSELDTEQCYEVIEQIVEIAPEAITILTGGEPLLRRDILEIVARATERGLWVVIGSNGVLITEALARKLKEGGVRGLALSLDSLDAAAHDGFRRVRGAFDNTVRGAKVLAEVGLPFIIQTTVGAHNHEDLEAIAAFAREQLGAKVWNLYFLVPAGRGTFVSDLGPQEYDQVLETLDVLRERYRGEMIVNAKCAPHFIKTVLAKGQRPDEVRTFSGAGGCPAGTQYLGIRPNGDLTPCPYLPVFAGNLKRERLADLWKDSELFQTVRRRTGLGDRCGACELAAHCGGCRARAYGASGDLLGEDPLCSHEPGTFEVPAIPEAALVYGSSQERLLAWEEAADERFKRIPAFVRGMVSKRVESWCRDRGVDTVTLEVLETIRAQMPTPKVFGR